MEQKWGFITGSNRGSGESILRKVVSNGYAVYAHARAQTEEFEIKVSELREQYGKEIRPVYFDLTDSRAMEREMKDIINQKGRIDVLINNAGVMCTGLFQMMEMQTIRETFDVNLFSAMNLTQWVLKLMVRQKKGNIVNITSIAGLDLGSGMCAYGVSKAAMSAFTKVLSTELNYYGIRVNAVAPGMTNTQMILKDSIQNEKELLKNKKGKFSRLAEKEEIADVVYFLSSEEASFINGQIIRVDGGNKLVF